MVTEVGLARPMKPVTWEFGVGQGLGLLGALACER